MAALDTQKPATPPTSKGKKNNIRLKESACVIHPPPALWHHLQGTATFVIPKITPRV